MATREQKELAARAKHEAEALRTYGDALLGGGVAEPFVTDTPFDIENSAAIIVGGAFHILGVYLAGKGDAP